MSRIALMNGFAYLDQYAPSIRQNIRYATNYNFLGQPLKCYKPYTVLTFECIHALQKAQLYAEKFGYDLIVYDGYRPKRAHLEFKQLLTINKPELSLLYYPYLEQKDIWEYLPKLSEHATGSAVAVSLIRKNKALLHTPIWSYKTFGGRIMPYCNDGTVDMCTSFSLFDKASSIFSTDVPSVFREKRLLLSNIMESAGFRPDPTAWWFFMLEQVPFSQRFDFLY